MSDAGEHEAARARGAANEPDLAAEEAARKQLRLGGGIALMCIVWATMLGSCAVGVSSCKNCDFKVIAG